MKTDDESGTQIRTLIVDDEPDILRFLGKCLNKQGHAVQLTDHPSQALEFLKQTHFDLVIADLKMPEMDGMTLLRQVKETSPLTEVIMMTGFATVSTAVGSMKLGAFDYLCKPFDVSEILEIIKRAIQHRHATENISRFRELDQMKEEFIRNVSHEMRAPLASINTASGILLDEFNSHGKRLEGATPEKMISIINRGSDRLVRMVDDLMDAFRFETKKIVLDKISFSVDRMIAECVEEFIAPCQERGLSLTSEVEPDLPFIMADPIKFRQAVLNLIGNAMKFTPPQGHITIGARKKQSDVLNGKILRVEIWVQDDGVGIDPKKQEKIFEKFYQVDGARINGNHGIGLGLALVKSIVEAHDGAISVRSVPGEGSIFCIQVPVLKEEYCGNSSAGSKTEKMDLSLEKVYVPSSCENILSDHGSASEAVPEVKRSGILFPYNKRNGK